MTTDAADDTTPRVPTAAELVAIPADDWASLLKPIRGALQDLPDPLVTPTIRRLRAVPASRLAGGRSRVDLAKQLAAGGPLWDAVVARLDAATLPASLGWLVAGGAPPSVPVRARTGGSASGDDQLAARLREQVADLKERLRVARDERDDARRRADGAEVRADTAAAQLAATDDELAALRQRVAELEAALAAAAQETARQVERERRRQDGALARLGDELTDARRALEEERSARRIAEQRAAGSSPPRPVAPQRRARPEPAPRGGALRLQPDRPSRLPRSIAAGTTEEAKALLHRGRLVLVDGYNVTKQHKGDLALEQQREWLIRLLGTLVATTGIEPVVVFDGRGERVSRAKPPRGVRVEFTDAGRTADDDLVFFVEAEPPDRPIVVVTDDRELRDRLRVHRVDLLRTAAFVQATR